MTPTNTQLFDRSKCTEEHSVASAYLTDCELLMRVNHPVLEAARESVERLLFAYPETHREVMRRRLVSCANKPQEYFHGAVFELYVADFIQRQGYKIEGLDCPLQDGSDRNVDYLVRSPSGDAFYLEATCLSGEEQTPEAVRARQDRAAFRFLVEEVCGGIATGSLSFVGEPTHCFDPHAAVQELVPWLLRKDRGSRRLSIADGYSVTFSPQPRRGAHHLVFGTTQEYTTIESKVTKKIADKAQRYRRALDAPLVIALNLAGPKFDDVDVVDGFLGTPRIALNSTSLKVMSFRDARGASFANGAVRDSVAGVLFFNKVLPIQLAHRTVDITYAANPLAPALSVPLRGVKYLDVRRDGSYLLRAT